jgi:hypothetical protein
VDAVAEDPRAHVRVGLLILVAGAVALTVIVLGGTEPATLLRGGSLGPSAALIEERFGRDALVDGEVGYDGQQFYAIADRLPDLEASAPFLDDPQYRLRRILGPAIASVAPQGSATVVVLFVSGLMGLALACGSGAWLAQRAGLPAWAGYLWSLPLLPALAFVTSEALAFGLGITGVALADRRRWGLATAVFTAGALARESVAVMAVATAIGLALDIRRSGQSWRPLVVLALVPGATVVAWSSYVASIVPAGRSDERIQVLGILDASATGAVLGVIVIALGLLATWRWRHVPSVWPVPLAFAAMCLVYFDLLFRWQAILRVSAPAVALGLMALARPATEPPVRPEQPLA